MDFRNPLQALFPGARAAVLVVLAQTTRPMTQRQIAERSGLSHPTVAEHVTDLERLGVVDRHLVGRSYHVTLNASLAAETVRYLDGLHHYVSKAMKQAVADCFDPLPISVTVFGSFVRGEASADSDIDVVIIAPPGLVDDDAFTNGVARWTDLVAELTGNPVSELVVDVSDLASKADIALWESIRREGQTLCGTAMRDLLPARELVG